MLAPVTGDAKPRAHTEPSGHDVVLVVEDNDAIAGLLVRMIERQGRGVIRARDGAEAERAYRENAARVGLVMLDCRLPDTHGAVLCQRFRQTSPLLPVLFTSGGRDQSAVAELLGGTGPTAFLPKPFLRADVDRAVAALLGAIA